MHPLFFPVAFDSMLCAPTFNLLVVRLEAVAVVERVAATLSSRCVFLKKLTAVQELPIFYETQNFMAVFQRTSMFLIMNYNNSVHNFMGYICRILSNVVRSSTRSSERSLALRFSG